MGFKLAQITENTVDNHNTVNPCKTSEFKRKSYRYSYGLLGRHSVIFVAKILQSTGYDTVVSCLRFYLNNDIKKENATCVYMRRVTTNL